MGLHQVLTIAKRLCVNAGSVSAVFASVQSSVSHETLQAVLLNGAWVSGGVACAAGAVWGATKVLASRQTAVPANRNAEEIDFAVIRKLAVSFFGERVSSLERMRQWAARNPGVFSVVTTELRKGARKIVKIEGYFCALPLSAAAAADVLAERCGVNDLDAVALCAPGTVPSAVYVGAVASKNEATKGAALQGLRALVKSMAKGRQNVMVLARPVTNDGLRLVQAFGLQPVRSEVGDPVGALHAGRLGQLAPARRTPKASRIVR
jgi:hypothetical protein